MNRRTFITGLLFVPLGVFFMLLFSMMDAFQLSTGLKWLGVALMIGGPFVFWEILPAWTDREDGVPDHGLGTEEPADP